MFPFPCLFNRTRMDPIVYGFLSAGLSKCEARSKRHSIWKYTSYIRIHGRRTRLATVFRPKAELTLFRRMRTKDISGWRENVCRWRVLVVMEWQRRRRRRLPPDSYTPIGQRAPLKPRPPRPKPLLSPTLDSTHPGLLGRKGRHIRPVSQAGVVCIMYYIPFPMSQPPTCHACRCSESRVRIPCVSLQWATHPHITRAIPI